MEYKLREFNSINSTNEDIYVNIYLTNKNKKLTEQDITHVVDVSNEFDRERQNSNKYCIYGGIEFFSLLNSVKTDYESFSDFFIEDTDSNAMKKTINNSFDFYLVRPIDYDNDADYENLINNLYQRKFEVIATNDDFLIDKQAFSKNIFNDEKHYYIINKDIVLDNSYDWFNKPITELYIMPIYKKQYTGSSDNDEEIYESVFNVKNDDISIEYEEITGETEYNIGDIIDGDVINWNNKSYNETKEYDKKIRIKTFYFDDNNKDAIMWWYNAFIPIRINYLENETNIENISGATYIDIPEYAVKYDDNGNYIWRNLIDKGYIDNLNNIGTNYPFVNGKHYIFTNVILKVIPDLDHENTDNKFEPSKISTTTTNNNSDPLNYGKLC